METPNVPPAPEEIHPEQRLQLLEQAISHLRSQLKQERVPGAPTTEELEAQLQTTLQKREKIDLQIQEAKALSKRRKREIDEWKLWYNSLEKVDRTDELRRLQSEIDWRAQEIARQEALIGRLNEEALAIEGTVEQLGLQIAARREGLHQLPLEEDPRLKAALEARDKLKKELRASS